MLVLTWLGEHRSNLVLVLLLVAAVLNIYSFVAQRRATVDIKQLLLRIRAESFAQSPMGSAALGSCGGAVSHRRFDFGELSRAVAKSARRISGGDNDASYGE